MPQLADISVKANDGTTNVVYTGVLASSGDKTPALWRNNAIAAANIFRPTYTVQSHSNGPKTARRVEGVYQYPTTTVGSDGKVNLSNRGIISFSALVPQGMLDSEVNEFVSQGLNLFNATLTKDQVKSGFAAT